MESIDINSIEGLINKEYLLQSMEVNTDAYGGACVKVAINVMKHLDRFEGEFNIGYHPDMSTPHGIICTCDNQGGISGFMAGAVRNTVAKCHILGWKFYLADLINQYNFNQPDDIDKYVSNIVNADLATESEAREYIKELIERFNKSQKDTI